MIFLNTGLTTSYRLTPSVVPLCPGVESKPFNMTFRTLMTWFLPACHVPFLTSFSDIELRPASSEAPGSCCGLSLAIPCVWKMKWLKCQGSGFKFRRHHLASCVNLAWLLNLCEPQFHHLKIGLMIVLISELDQMG